MCAYKKMALMCARNTSVFSFKRWESNEKALPAAGDTGKKDSRICQRDYLFFLAMPQITQRIPIPRTGKNGATGAFVGEAGTLTITTTGAGVGVVENTAGMFTEGIVTLVLGIVDSACAWHWPL
jgi:hypothetical protein